VLHPRHKLTYFKNAGWETDWIDAAERIVRTEFKRSYARDDGVDVDVVDGERLTDDEEMSAEVSTILPYNLSCLTFARLPECDIKYI
jgi:hypothetical protein